MRRRDRLAALQVLLTFAYLLTAESSAVLVTQALKGRVFGSPNSSDVAKRIVIGGDGSIYIAGITTPAKAGILPWGDAEAGEVTGKTDIFLAKFSTSGRLVWVKRTGSAGEDVLNDLKLANGGLYLCGSTTGKFAIDPRGSSDAFVMKYTLDGIKAWRHPFQFGSSRYDTCNSLQVDASSNTVYLTGTTMGKVFGSVTPANATTHYFVASFTEIFNDDAIGLQLIQGRQRGSHGNSSGDGIVMAKNRVFLMTSEWEDFDKKDRSITYLSELDREGLVLRKLHVIKTSDEGSFQGKRMTAVNETGDVYIAGVTNLPGDRKEYHAVKFSFNEGGGTSGVMWATRVGSVSSDARMMTQTPSIVADASRNVAYVAGVEDGYFTDGKSGIVIVPMFKLRMDNGEIAQRWQRATTIPLETEEVTDIALDPGKVVVYTGSWDGGPEFHANVLIGSFGSRGHSSRSPGSRPVTNGAFIQAGAANEEEKKKMGRGKVVGFVLLGLGVAGVVLTALVAFGMRSSKRNINMGDDKLPLTDNAMEEHRRQVAESHRSSGFSQAEANDVVVGGSASPR